VDSIQDRYGPLSQESWAGDVSLKGSSTQLKVSTLGQSPLGRRVVWGSRDSELGVIRPRSLVAMGAISIMK